MNGDANYELYTMIIYFAMVAVVILVDLQRSLVECVLVSTQMQLARLALVSTTSYTASTYHVSYGILLTPCVSACLCVVSLTCWCDDALFVFSSHVMMLCLYLAVMWWCCCWCCQLCASHLVRRARLTSDVHVWHGWRVRACLSVCDLFEFWLWIWVWMSCEG